jgi:hypothetical protein
MDGQYGRQDQLLEVGALVDVEEEAEPVNGPGFLLAAALDP